MYGFINYRDISRAVTLIVLCVYVPQIEQLHEAIEELFYFEFILDEIPLWGFVGYIEESGFLPHSHKVSPLRLHPEVLPKQ